MFEVTDDPQRIKEKLETEKLLCYVLNEKLTSKHIKQINGESYVVEVHYDNRQVSAVICGLYKKKLHPLDMEKLLDSYTRMNVLDKLITEPTLCYLLNEALDEKTIEIMAKAYDMLQIKYENEDRDAIACVYYTG